MGAVWFFTAPAQHTYAYPYCGIQIFTVYYNKVRLIFCVLNLVFFIIFTKFIVSHCGEQEGVRMCGKEQVGTNHGRWG